MAGPSGMLFDDPLMSAYDDLLRPTAGLRRSDLAPSWNMINSNQDFNLGAESDTEQPPPDEGDPLDLGQRLYPGEPGYQEPAPPPPQAPQEQGLQLSDFGGINPSPHSFGWPEVISQGTRALSDTLGGAAFNAFSGRDRSVDLGEGLRNVADTTSSPTSWGLDKTKYQPTETQPWGGSNPLLTFQSGGWDGAAGPNPDFSEGFDPYADILPEDRVEPPLYLEGGDEPEAVDNAVEERAETLSPSTVSPASDTGPMDFNANLQPMDYAMDVTTGRPLQLNEADLARFKAEDHARFGDLVPSVAGGELAPPVPGMTATGFKQNYDENGIPIGQRAWQYSREGTTPDALQRAKFENDIRLQNLDNSGRFKVALTKGLSDIASSAIGPHGTSGAALADRTEVQKDKLKADILENVTKGVREDFMLRKLTEEQKQEEIQRRFQSQLQTLGLTSDEVRKSRTPAANVPRDKFLQWGGLVRRKVSAGMDERTARRQAAVELGID